MRVHQWSQLRMMTHASRVIGQFGGNGMAFLDPELIADRAARLRISHTWLAEKIKRPKSWVGRVLNGKVIPRVNEAKQFSDVVQEEERALIRHLLPLHFHDKEVQGFLVDLWKAQKKEAANG